MLAKHAQSTPTQTDNTQSYTTSQFNVQGSNIHLSKVLSTGLGGLTPQHPSLFPGHELRP